MESVNNYTTGRKRKFSVSPRLEKLKQDFEKNGGKWKEYRVGDLFDIHPTKSYGLTNSKLFETNGSTPVIVNSSLNNGVGGYVNLEATESGNMITFSDTTTADAIFYQPNDFIGYSHVQGLYPYLKECWNEKRYLYFLIAFRKTTCGRFDYANKFNRTIAKELLITLPTVNNAIDFDFMESYISELEEERISELAAYLKVTGLDNYELTQKECTILKTSTGGAFQTFKIEDVFTISTTKKKFNAIDVTFKGKYPYVVRTSLNNGIKGYITENEEFLNAGNTISFGQDTATMFYQEKPYFTGDKIKIMSLKNYELTGNIANYLISVMTKAFSSFKWGQSSFNEKVLNNTQITLPITSTGSIDYNYMETYITAIQKLTIKNIVQWKDKVIKTTKKVI